MPTHTFFADASIGKLMIKKYKSSNTIETLKQSLASPSLDNDVVFHDDYNFIRIVGSVEVAVVTFPQFSRNTISWSSGGGKCYITTACCAFQGLPDDCSVLTSMRKLRDEYILRTPEGFQIVDDYYNTAPDIVDALSNKSGAISIYHEMYNKYLLEIEKLVDQNKMQSAMDLYIELVDYAKKESEE